jgi:prepilin peptidase CpaA
MESLITLPLIVVLVCVLAGAGTDLWNFRLPNVLTIPFFLTGLLYHLVSAGTIGLAFSVLGAIVGSAPLLIPFVRGGLGAGDVKLMAGVGAWLGPWAALHVFIVSGLAMGCCSAGLLVACRARGVAGLGGSLASDDVQLAQDSSPESDKLAAVLRRPDRRRRVIPFGALVALGVVVTALWIGGTPVNQPVIEASRTTFTYP